MKLFDDIERTYNGYSKLNEDTYPFLQRSTKREFSEVREYLDNWFSRYPENEKKEFKNSFQKSFDDRFFELFLHEIFLKLGFSIEIHPDIPFNTKHPDFLISKDVHKILVEAKVVRGKSSEEENAHKRENQLLEVLDKIEFKGFGLTIPELEIKSENQPATAEIINSIKKNIGQLDHAYHRKGLEDGGDYEIPKFEYDSPGVRMVYKALPLPFEKSNVIHSGILIYPWRTAWGGGEKKIRKAIYSKAKYYSQIKAPLLLCLNSLDWKTNSETDVINCIWGTQAISIRDNISYPTRRKNGVFFDSRGPKLQNISAILVTKVNSFNLKIADYWLYENPYANYKLNFEILGLSSTHVINDELKVNQRRKFHEILY